jgi:hypothetical protein
MLSLHMWSVKAQDSLQLQVSMDKEAYDPDELIRISGRVSLSDGSPVENALVSIQVIGPTGETYHVVPPILGWGGGVPRRVSCPAGISQRLIHRLREGE